MYGFFDLFNKREMNFPTKNSKYPDLGSRMYHMYDVVASSDSKTPLTDTSGQFQKK